MEHPYTDLSQKTIISGRLIQPRGRRLVSKLLVGIVNSLPPTQWSFYEMFGDVATFTANVQFSQIVR